MKKEQVLDLMNAIPPDLIEESDIQAPAKHRLPGLARAGLIAACLCLALVGVGAAAVVHGWVNVSDPSVTVLPHRDGGTVSITEYKISEDGSVYIPLESFSQEALDYASSFMRLPQFKSFDSWQAAEDFLGVYVGADNPVLDKARLITQPATNLDDYSSYYESDLPGYHVSPSTYQHDAANCLVTFSGHPDHPDCISLSSRYELEALNGTPFNLSLEANIYTFARSSDWQGIDIQVYDREVATENYTTPSGLQTVIITEYQDLNLHDDYGITTYDDAVMTTYQVRFLLNGAHYTMLTLCTSWDYDNADEDVLPVIKEVLDGFSVSNTK